MRDREWDARDLREPWQGAADWGRARGRSRAPRGVRRAFDVKDEMLGYVAGPGLQLPPPELLPPGDGERDREEEQHCNAPATHEKRCG